MIRHFVLALIALILSTEASPVFAQRVALVIANSRYVHATALKNPGSDGQLIAASLRRAGFTSVDVRLDLNKSALETELRNFGKKSDGAEVALIYYAGHGIEAGGQNYIIPVDAKLERDRDLELEATRLDTVLLMSESAKLRIVVLDACRNNPFMATMQRTMRNRAVGRGLAAVEPEGETLVVYAAKAGATAADGDGTNSPFAQALARRLVQPGLEISLLFRSVRDDVLTQTGRTQEPFTYGSLSGNAFYFVPPSGVAVAAPVQTHTVTAAPSVSAATSEALYWQGTLSANSERGYRDYLKRYPKGEYSSIAQENLQRFIQPAPKPVTAPAPRVQPQQSSPQSGSSNSGAGTFFSGLGLGNFSSGFANAGQSSSSLSGDAARRFQFTPSAAVRSRVRREFIASLRQSDQTSASLLESFMPENNPFGQLESEFRKNGLSTSNMADTFSVFVDSMRDVANGADNSGSPQQYVALRNQFAAFMAQDSSSASLSQTQLQERSDLAVMVTTYVILGYEASKAVSADQKRQYSDLIANMAVQSLGVDLRKVRLTNSGYQF
jgi:uncharacterized caspase-like protein